MMEKKKGIKVYFTAVVALALIVTGAIAVLKFIGLDVSSVKQKVFEEQEYNLVLDDFVVNIDSEEKTQRYLKAQITIAYSDKGVEKILVEKTSLIRDLIISDLMNCTSEQLLDTDRLDGFKASLKGEINQALGEEAVAKVYFTDFLIQ